MNRRRFFAHLVGGAAAATVCGPTAPAAAPRRYGRVDVASHAAHRRLTGEDLHVYLNGIDVTRDCVVANDVYGYAELLCRDPDTHRRWTAAGGVHVHAASPSICRLLVYGDVVIRPRPR